MISMFFDDIKTRNRFFDDIKTRNRFFEDIKTRSQFLCHRKFLYHRNSRIFRGDKNLQNAIISIYVPISGFFGYIKVKAGIFILRETLRPRFEYF